MQMRFNRPGHPGRMVERDGLNRRTTDRAAYRRRTRVILVSPVSTTAAAEISGRSRRTARKATSKRGAKQEYESVIKTIRSMDARTLTNRSHNAKDRRKHTSIRPNVQSLDKAIKVFCNAWKHPKPGHGFPYSGEKANQSIRANGGILIIILTRLSGNV